ncbi:hypothetical protein M885DRAFT_565107 [Pelagophyceae sp. CCMP2097]|nr:hypothetical protein M885DRAFT_565107 [Pelagophyceae sp. CCMP2097]
MFAGAPVLLRGYGVETDWRALAAYDQNVKLAADGCVDWNQSGARLTVAKALLSRDFGLPQWDMPPERLCPCVPNRVAYIAWIADLLDDDDEGGTADGADSVCAGGAARSVRGIDIGTGASCIYALLGARARGWRFVATDSDADAVERGDALFLGNAAVEKIRGGAT